ncbi:MAG TPA: undecaprenyldiphospho-muramoylpentapeptide beta-N-acetylglucosaminyltransferase [Ktedonobacteraceae bacterium]
MRVLISGGGTGGHVYPALAVATRLRDLYQADILYLGSDDGLETQLVPAAGLRLATVQAGKLQRYLSWHTVKGVARVPLGMVQALSIVRRFRPEVAFTSGGYVAVPAGLAARVQNVPLLMHQQDVPPNLANRLLAPIATRISVAFAGSLPYFSADKSLLLGNPLRQELLDVRQTAPQEAKQTLGFAQDLPLVLITGGSQGARHLNQVLCRALPELLPFCQVLQISGQKLFAETQTLSAGMLEGLSSDVRQRYHLVPYMSDEMPLALRAADLVICRSGASTLSELALLAKASVLVPLPPTMGKSPQEANAAFMAKHRAALVIKNEELQPAPLVEQVRSILLSEETRQELSRAIAAFGKEDATQEIVATLVNMAQGSMAQDLKKQEVIRH